MDCLWNFLDKYVELLCNFVYHLHHHIGFLIVAPLVISCEEILNDECYDANEMQKVKILLIFSGTKSRAVTLRSRSRGSDLGGK